MAFRIAEAFVEFATRGYDVVIAQVDSIAAQIGNLAGITPAVDFSGAAASASGLGAAVNAAANDVERLAIGTSLARTEMTSLALLTGRVESAAGVAQARLFNYRVVGESATAAVASGFRLGAFEIGQMISRFSALNPLVGRMGALISGVAFAVRSLGTAWAATAAIIGVSSGGLLAIVAAIGAVVVGVAASIAQAFKVDPEAQRLFEDIGESIKGILADIGGPLLDALEAIAKPLAVALQTLDRMTDAIAEINRVSKEFTGAGIGQNLVNGIAAALPGMREAIFLAERLYKPGADTAKGGGGGGFSGITEFQKTVQSAVSGADNPVVTEQKKTNAILERVRDLLDTPAGRVAAQVMGVPVIPRFAQ